MTQALGVMAGAGSEAPAAAQLPPGLALSQRACAA